MGEFTKDELEEIIGSMSCRNIDRILDGKLPLNSDLINRIQSMINNYCEHDTYSTSALINLCVHCNKSEFVSL